jgi:hypothetical protein
MSDLLRAFDGRLREVFFLGTAGFSPRRGGILDPDACDDAQGGGAADDALVTIGDVCVSPFATNWDCQRCVWGSEASSGSVCRRPLCSMHGREDLFGELVCTFWGGRTSIDLADEVLAASTSAPLPPLPPKLARAMDVYWRAMSDGTGKDYLSALRPTNRVYGYTTCSEATSNTFWSGAPYDHLAREYVAGLTNIGLQRLGLHPSRNLTARDTVGVSAMEATGWISLLMMREAYQRGAPIPLVNLRAAADYTHAPVCGTHTRSSTHAARRSLLAARCSPLAARRSARARERMVTPYSERPRPCDDAAHRRCSSTLLRSLWPTGVATLAHRAPTVTRSGARTRTFCPRRASRRPS